MTKEDKQRVIGKVVAINSDRFSVELLSGLENVAYTITPCFALE
jgi:hypothetical protein